MFFFEQDLLICGSESVGLVELFLYIDEYNIIFCAFVFHLVMCFKLSRIMLGQLFCMSLSSSVHSLGLPSLLSDPSAKTPEEALVHIFGEAKRTTPSILYLPQFHLWWDTVS
jgi:hypothetical protein